MKAKLSTLWIFILFNQLFRDVHELFRPGALSEMQTGIMNGNEITDSLLLIGGIMAEIPILMVILSRVLNHNVNRWINIIVAVLTSLMTIQNGANDMDDVFFMTIILITLVIILWQAWTWKQNNEPSIAS